jgi:hypothetical protein
VYRDNKANLSGTVMVCEQRAAINDSKCVSIFMSVDQVPILQKVQILVYKFM